ncbi:Peptidyl-prolyl cis-trans isomerase D, partial [Stylophora pistillata]
MLFFGRGANSQNVATVGKISITPTEFVQQLRREAAQIQVALGKKLSPNQLQQLGVIQGILRRLVQGALIDQEAERLGLVVSDADIRKKTHTNPSFLNKEGKFDRGMFETFLYNANLTEKEYIKMMRQDVRRSQLMGALGGQVGASVPATLAEPLFFWQNEKREVLYTHFLAKDETQVDVPSEQDLIAFHQDNAAFFTIPEKRNITYILLKAEKKEGSDEFDTEELYSLSTKIEDDLAEGMTLEEVAEKNALKVNTLKDLTSQGDNTNNVDSPDLKSPEFISTAFETEEGEVSPMVPTSDGTTYFTIRIDSASPTHLQPLEEAKDQVTKLWKEKRQMELAKEYAQDAANRMNQGKYAFPKMAIIKRYIFTRTGPEDEKLRKKIDPRLTSKLFGLSMG